MASAADAARKRLIIELPPEVIATGVIACSSGFGPDSRAKAGTHRKQVGLRRERGVFAHFRPGLGHPIPLPSQPEDGVGTDPTRRRAARRRAGLDAGAGSRPLTAARAMLQRERKRHPRDEETGPMKRTTPPYRADHVGSFLRSAPIKEAREKREKGQISAAELKKVEDQEIPKAHQEAGRGRPAMRHRRRIPPHVLALRFLRRARRRRDLRTRPRHPVPGRADQAARASASTARSISPIIRCSSTSSSSRRTPR